MCRPTRGPRSQTEVEGCLSPSHVLPRRGGLSAGRRRLAVLVDRSGKSLETFALELIQPNPRLTTDDGSGDDRLSSKGYRLTPVPPRGDPNVTEAWLPLIQFACGNLKTWLKGIPHGV